MSSKIINALTRSLPIASAALIMHIGGAAAETPQTDFQHQVSAVLAGATASHSSLRARSASADSTGPKVDAQQFAQQLLLGWNASHPASAGSAAELRGPRVSDVIPQDSPARGDIQSMVQRFLQGQKAAARAAS